MEELRQSPNGWRDARRRVGVVISRMVLRRFLRVVCSVATLALGASAQMQLPKPPETPPQAALTQAQNPPLNPALPTVFIVGDSTARNGADLGWGDHASSYFDTARINVANRARAGRSSRTFLNEGSWEKVLAEMKPGDYVLLQFGHNDGGDLDGAKPRGTLKGIGDDSKEVTLLDGRHEIVHSYGWYVRKYIAETRARKATPILLTLTVRNIWKGGKIERDMGYTTYLKELAASEHLELVEMGEVEADELEKLGQEKTATLFPIDHTHTSPEGAELNARAVALALRQAHTPLATFLRP